MNELDVIARHAWKLSGMQTYSELRYMLGVVAELQPRVILEIGTRNGATLWGMAQAAPGAVLVSVDPTNERRHFEQLIPGAELHAIAGDSHDLGTLLRVQFALAGRPVDFLFVDGDHTEQGCRADVDDYAPLLSPSGLLCLHDVALHCPEQHVGVQPVWEALRGLPGAFEFVDPEPGQVALGYGFVPAVALGAPTAV